METMNLENLQIIMQKDTRLEKLMQTIESYKQTLNKNEEIEVTFEKGTLNINFHKK